MDIDQVTADTLRDIWEFLENEYRYCALYPEILSLIHISSLPISEHEAYQEEGFCGICTGGTAVIEVFSVRSPISENDIVTILPLQLVSIREVSDDFSMTFFKVDKEMFLDIMSGLGKITPDFFFYMRKNFLYSVNDCLLYTSRCV